MGVGHGSIMRGFDPVCGLPADHGGMTVTVQLTAAHPLFDEAVELFDEYRQHYGANPAPAAVEQWMRDRIISDRMRVFVAIPGEHVRGICTVAVVPASLTLRTVWLVRDIYVDPDARRGGIGRALLAQVADAARAGGAHRLSLQAEATNTRALQLYAKAGFETVSEVTLLHRIL
jgi:GNAT superfamily N-acetyltransferase